MTARYHQSYSGGVVPQNGNKAQEAQDLVQAMVNGTKELPREFNNTTQHSGTGLKPSSEMKHKSKIWNMSKAEKLDFAMND